VKKVDDSNLVTVGNAQGLGAICRVPLKEDVFRKTDKGSTVIKKLNSRISTPRVP
jgi:hypothetical protein